MPTGALLSGICCFLLLFFLARRIFCILFMNLICLIFDLFWLHGREHCINAGNGFIRKSHFTFTFLQLYCPDGISSTGNSGRFPSRKSAATKSRYPSLRCMLGVSVLHKPTISDMYYRIFNARTDVNACDCTRGCTDTVRVCTAPKSLAAPGNRTRVSGVPVRRSSYIPTLRSIDSKKCFKSVPVIGN